MICVKCKKNIPEESVYCMLCGKKQVSEERKHKKRSNGSGSIVKLSGNRKKPWRASKGGMMIGTYATRAEAQKALNRLTDVDVTERFNFTFSQVYEMRHREKIRELDKSPKQTLQPGMAGSDGRIRAARRTAVFLPPHVHHKVDLVRNGSYHPGIHRGPCGQGDHKTIYVPSCQGPCFRCPRSKQERRLGTN